MVNGAPLSRTLLQYGRIAGEPRPPVILTDDNGRGRRELRRLDGLEGAALHSRNPENREVVLRNDERGGQLRVVRGQPNQSQSSYERATLAVMLIDPANAINPLKERRLSRYDS